MKLLKIIVVVFLIYFIRRFIQMYKVVKALNENKNDHQDPPGPQSTNSQPENNSKVVDADFKVID